METDVIDALDLDEPTRTRLFGMVSFANLNESITSADQIPDDIEYTIYTQMQVILDSMLQI